MALTVQSVINDVSDEVFEIDGSAGSGDAFDLQLRWVDQVHKDLLHTSVFKHMTRATTTVTSIAGTRSYAITPTNIRQIIAVYDHASEKFLTPLESVMAPVSLTDPTSATAPRPPKPFDADMTDCAFPRFYLITTVVTTGTPAHTLHLFPPPEAAENAGTVTIYYNKLVSTVSSGSTNLDVGDDGRDAMVAGVLARAWSYMHVEEKATYWSQRYDALKQGSI